MSLHSLAEAMRPKKKMQDVSFRDVDDFLEFLPKDERKIVDVLRNLVFQCLPDAREKLSYNVPYFFGKQRIAFIWPASVPWGMSQTEGVLLGFCKGHLMRDPYKILDRTNRKVVGTLLFTDLTQIDEDVIREYLFEAGEIDVYWVFNLTKQSFI